MRIIFWGTPAVGAAHLKALKEQTSHTIAAVITKPDQPRNRGQKNSPSEVKKTAMELGISPILTPDQVKTPEFTRQIREFQADLGVVVAYGKILSDDLLKTTKLGFINVHFSLLPKLRGPSPVEYAILEGLSETGCTTFWIEKTCDTGDLIEKQSLPIKPLETAPELRARLCETGISVLLKTLDLIAKNQAPRIPQDHTQATHSAMIKKEQGRIDPFKENAETIERKVRAFREWPRVSMRLWDRTVQILNARAKEEEISEPWRIVKGKGFVLKCAQGSLLVTDVQAEGKPPASAWSFLQGLRLKL